MFVSDCQIDREEDGGKGGREREGEQEEPVRKWPNTDIKIVIMTKQELLEERKFIHSRIRSEPRIVHCPCYMEVDVIFSEGKELMLCPKFTDIFGWFSSLRG